MLQRKRKSISFETKSTILRKLEDGEKIVSVAQYYDLNESTVRSIRNNALAIKQTVANGKSLDKVVRNRPQIIEKMESALMKWIENGEKKGIQLDRDRIREEAKKCYQTLIDNGEDPADKDFVASVGWFNKFKNRVMCPQEVGKGDSPPVTGDYSGPAEYPSTSTTLTPAPALPPPVKKAKKSKPPETVEELMKEENKLLKEIVKQNQQVLSRTAEILEQNHLLINMLMNERNKDYDGDNDEDCDWNGDPLDTVEAQFEEEEDGRVSNHFLSGQADDTIWDDDVATVTGNEAELPHSCQVKKEGIHSKHEEDVEMEDSQKDLNISNDLIPSKTQPGTSRETQKTSTKTKNVSKFRNSKPRDRMNQVIHFPITTLSRLTEIDQRMAEEEDFKRTILEYLKRIKLKGGGLFQLISKDVLELKLETDLSDSRKSMLLEEAQRKFSH